MNVRNNYGQQDAGYSAGMHIDERHWSETSILELLRVGLDVAAAFDGRRGPLCTWRRRTLNTTSGGGGGGRSVDGSTQIDARIDPDHCSRTHASHR